MPEPPTPTDLQLGNSDFKSRPRLLIFDSGLGGLTVQAEIARLCPDSVVTYLADDAVFPYGRLSEADVLARVDSLMATYIPQADPHVVVIACNTASTLVLPPLRARWPHIPFVGTVPAIKPAAEASKSGLISVLATPGTVARDYTRELIARYASHCAVNLVGSSALASVAEGAMQGAVPDEATIAAEIAPCFVTQGARRTDVVVLACTHYPLLRAQFKTLAPWPVQWIDPAPAIARRVAHLLADQGFAHPSSPGTPAPRATGTAIFTSGSAPNATLAKVLAGHGLIP